LGEIEDREWAVRIVVATVLRAFFGRFLPPADVVLDLHAATGRLYSLPREHGDHGLVAHLLLQFGLFWLLGFDLGDVLLLLLLDFRALLLRVARPFLLVVSA